MQVVVWTLCDGLQGEEATLRFKMNWSGREGIFMADQKIPSQAGLVKIVVPCSAAIEETRNCIHDVWIFLTPLEDSKLFRYAQVYVTS